MGSNNLSPGATVVAFDPIVVPMRIPVPADGDDDPSIGEWILAFKDEESWRQGWQKCERNVSQQCETGARMGCSITSAKGCRIPWWKHVLVFMKAARIEKGEREACEEREMRACLAGSKESCTRFAKDTCEPVFTEARIAESDVPLDPRFTGPSQGRRDWNVSSEKKADTSGFQASEYGKTVKSTNFRGRKLMTKEYMQRFRDGPNWSEKAVEGDICKDLQAPIDGWEGGLIRPKVGSQSTRS